MASSTRQLAWSFPRKNIIKREGDFSRPVVLKLQCAPESWGGGWMVETQIESVSDSVGLG